MTPKSLNRTTGKLGEQIGEGYLREQGYQILERNVRSPFGEIDLVADDGGTLAFVEIKTRRDSTFGLPEEAVNKRKRKQLVRLASWYLARHPKLCPSVRFDVLAVQIEGEARNVRLIRDAFDLEPI
ncbi:MAG: YraN family protein [Candidatus Omnitrophica bacterium]|nr:YraN family protein [Candidatus Omnitrophota bacterium]